MNTLCHCVTVLSGKIRKAFQNGGACNDRISVPNSVTLVKCYKFYFCFRIGGQNGRKTNTYETLKFGCHLV